jgi:hypothetical protein
MATRTARSSSPLFFPTRRYLAVKALETSVLLGPQHSQPHYNLAIGNEKAGRLRDAMMRIVRALQIAAADLMPATQKQLSVPSWGICDAPVMNGSC